METVLLVDTLDSAIHPGDYLIDESGKVYLVVLTENSFIRQGFLRVYQVNLRRGFYCPVDNHTYVRAEYSVRFSPDEVEKLPGSPVEIRSIFRKLIEPSRETNRHALRERHMLRRLP